MRLGYKQSVGFENCRHHIEKSVKNIYGDISNEKFGPYSMNGVQSATSTVNMPYEKTGSIQKKTTLQMHSEMLVVRDMLDRNHWRIIDGKVFSLVDYSFVTVQPHCGYCTLVLQVLGLPLSVATMQNYNLSSSFDYQLPPLLAKDFYFLNSFLNYGDTHSFLVMRKLLDNCFKTTDWLLSFEGMFINSQGLNTPCAPPSAMHVTTAGSTNIPSAASAGISGPDYWTATSSRPAAAAAAAAASRPAAAAAASSSSAAESFIPAAIPAAYSASSPSSSAPSKIIGANTISLSRVFSAKNIGHAINEVGTPSELDIIGHFGAGDSAVSSIAEDIFDGPIQMVGDKAIPVVFFSQLMEKFGKQIWATIWDVIHVYNNGRAAELRMHEAKKQKVEK